jgi:predicted Rossmann-fold nucleotide-binding protein
VPERQVRRLRALGQAIASGCDVTLTGACNGMPDVVRSAATEVGGLTIGISPHRTAKEHRQAEAPYRGFTVLQFTSLPFSQRNRKGPNFMGRQIDEVAHADAGIVVGGRFGTTIEALTMIEEGRPLGVLTGTGGTAKVMQHLLREAARAGKKPRAPVIFDSNPERLVRRLRAATLEYKALGLQGPIGDT